MEADGIDLASFLEDGPLPQMPDDLDDLLTEELMQFLSAAETGQPVCQQHQVHQQQAFIAAPMPTGAVAFPGNAPSSSSSSRSEGANPPSPVVGTTVPLAAANLVALQAQPAVATCGVVPRLVTTTAAQQMWTAMLQAALAPSAAPCVGEAKTRPVQPAATSRQGSHDCSADSSDTDHDDQEMVDSKNKGQKRKAQEVDWRQIDDPAERRRQRRLAKNRVTAARSRERKKAMWSELEEKLKSMENENTQLRSMLEQFARENSSLKSQLLSFTRAGLGASGFAGLSQARAGKTTDPATILPVFIVTLLVVCSLLPGDKACALLGSVLPLALIASVMLGAANSGATGGDDDDANSSAGMDCLLRLLHMLGTLLSGSSRTLQKSFRRLLFERHRILGRNGMRLLAAASPAVLLRDGCGCGGIGKGCCGSEGVGDGGGKAGSGAAADDVPACAAASKAGCCAESAVPQSPVVVKMEPAC